MSLFVRFTTLQRMGLRTLLLALLSFCSPLSALSPQPVYVMGVENLDYYPYFAFTYRNSFAEELLRRFSDEEKLRFDYRPLPVKRLYDALLTQQTIDLKFPDSPTWATEQKMGHTLYYSESISDYVEGIYVLPQNRGQGLSHLKRLGIIQGFTPSAFGDTLQDLDIELVRDGDLSKLLLMCLRGEIDGVYAQTDLSHHWLTHNPDQPAGLIFDPELPYIEGQFHLSTTRYPELIERFNAFLQREQKQIQALRERYGIDTRPIINGS